VDVEQRIGGHGEQVGNGNGVGPGSATIMAAVTNDDKSVVATATELKVE